MIRIIESLAKKIGLSSNQLLKCVLLNTAIELFSYTDASTYSSPGYRHHDWNMEDFDHLYSAAPDTRQILECTEIWHPSLPSDHINQSPSLDEDTACITSVEELETMYLQAPENLCVHEQVNHKLDCYTLNNSLGKSESFYYLAGPVNVWLEFPLAQKMPATLAPLSPAEVYAAEVNIHWYFGKESSFPDANTELSSETKMQDAAINSRGVQTTEELLTTGRNKTLENSQRYSFSGSLNHEADGKDSIFWDSYDLHLSRSPMECAHTNIFSGWEPKNKDHSNIEDLFMLVNMEDFDHLYSAAPDTRQILECAEIWHPSLPSDRFSGWEPKTKDHSNIEDLFMLANTTHLVGVQPTSSTPYLKDPSSFLQSKGKVNAVEKLKRQLFNEEEIKEN